MKKFFSSLLAKYMLIILMALSLVQIAFLIISIFVSGFADNIENRYVSDGITTDTIEEKWHEEASNLQNITDENIHQHFAKWKEEFPDASMFWVDENGQLREQLGVNDDLPHEWTVTDTARFIKSRYGEDPFTVIAFIDADESNGFIVFEIPRATLQPPLQTVYDYFGPILLIGTLIIILLFIIVSFLFFRGIRKRLLKLQEAMEIRDVDGLPLEISVRKKDEIGQLEQTFNQMVIELKESKHREQKEEQLRKELIANLSHDLRTPLTKLRAQSYSISKEKLSQESRQAIQILEASVEDIDRLIENLMSYTLLTASKYQLKREEIDIIRYVRQHLATWYPVFENEGFDIEIKLHSFQDNLWLVDPIWVSRIIDNLLQNILRHAKNGKYIEVRTETTDKYDAFIFADKGQGMKKESEFRGASIGLSIVDMMVKGMKLDWRIASSAEGTIVRLIKYHKE